MKGLHQLLTFSGGVLILFVKLTILSRVMWFRYYGHMLWSLQHLMFLHLYQYASGICGEASAYNFKPRPLVSLPCIPISRDLCFLIGICAFRIDFCCMNKIYGLSQSLS